MNKPGSISFFVFHRNILHCFRKTTPVVQVIKEKTVTASDGNTYLISVTYDSDSGVPMDAELEVSELLEGTEAYDSYVQKTAEALEKEVKHLAFAHAFDISLIDPATGAHCQPTKPVAVSIRLLRESIQQGDNVSVVHFPDSQTENPSEMGEMDTENPSEGEILGVNVNGETVEFESTGFSVYVVAKEDKIQKYVFHNYDSAGNLYIFSEQALITGESLVRPSDPTKAGAVFDHWATEKNGAAAVDFSAYNPITVDNTKTQEQLDAAPVNFYAVYGAAKTVVVFYNQSGLVVEKVERNKPAVGESAVTLDTNDVSYTPIQDKEGAVLGFNYWTTDAHGTGAEVQLGDDAAVGEIRITATSPDTIELYPNLSEGRYIYFDGNKDSYSGISSVPYTGPVFVPNENNAAASATAAVNSLNARTDSYGIPVVDGYTFKGWYIDVSDANDATTAPVFEPDGAGRMKVNQDEFNLLLNSSQNLPNNPTLYAHWTPKTNAPYTVVFWRQKITDDKNATDAEKTYDFAESDTTRTGTPGNTVSPTEADMGKGGSGDYNHFSYNGEKSVSVTVNADGSTVLNVYYDRDLMTFLFKRQGTVYTYNKSNSNSSGYYYIPDGNGGYEEVYLWRNNNRWWRERTYYYYYGY